MRKYLVKVKYTKEGTAGLLKDGGTKRQAVVDKLFKSVGGKLEAFYYALGDTDLYVIAEFPDETSVAAALLAVSASGSVTTSSTALLTPAEIDEATKKTNNYTPPGV